MFPETSSPRPSARSWGFGLTYGAYLFVLLLLVLPSLRAWFQQPFRVQAYDFDFFLTGNPKWLAFGQALHVVLLAVVGALFYVLATRHRASLEAMSRGQWALMLLAPCLLSMTGLPWMNPDVFYYIGDGWLDAYYRLDAFAHSMSQAPGFRADEMFRDVDPRLLAVVGNYGPMHQNLCATLAGLSGGNIRVALLLFKLSNAAFLLGSAGLVYSLARTWRLPARHLVFCYLCNPLVLVCFLAWVHNDVHQNFCALLTLFWLQRGRPVLAGGSLGAAVCFKYVGIVLLPALLVYWLLASVPGRRVRHALLCLLGFVGVFCLIYGLNPDAWAAAVLIYTGNWSPYRSSVYFLVDPVARWVGGMPIARVKTVLTLLYVLVGAGITLGPLWRRWRRGGPDGEWTPQSFARQGFWLYACYFLMCAPAVLEWYFTWILGFALLLTDRRYLQFVLVLFSFYLPAVIYTIEHSIVIARPVNLALYLFFAVLLGVLFRRRTNAATRVAAAPLPGGMAFSQPAA